MNGRKENEQKTQVLIDKMLAGKPRYLKEYYETISSKSYTTQFRYLHYIINFLDFVKNEYELEFKQARQFKNMKVSMINAYMNSLKYKDDGTENSYGMKANKFYAIKDFFNYLVNDEYIAVNPCGKVKLPKDNDRHEIISLTKDEIQQIKENVMNGVGNEEAVKRQKNWRNRDLAVIMLSLSLGLRVTSVSEINIEDVDFNNNLLRVVEKGNKVRELMFSDSIKEILLNWMKDRRRLMSYSGKQCDALFITYQIQRMRTPAITKMIKKYTYNIDKHITPHKLRSTCATNVYDKTGDIYLVANVLGHSNLANTKRYIQVSNEKRKQAAQAMDDILF